MPSTTRRHRRPSGLKLREEFGLSQAVLARLMGVSERTIATWEAGKEVHETTRRAVAAGERLLRGLAQVIRKAAIAGWLTTPNEAFGGLKPLEVVERGEADRLWRMIYQLGSGTLS